MLLRMIRDAAQQILRNGLPAVKPGTAAYDKRYRHAAPKLGPYSRAYVDRTGWFGIKLDGRTKEAAFVRKLRNELLAFLNTDEPSIIQKMLVDRASILMLRLSQIDNAIIEGKIQTTLDQNQTIAWHNALTRTLVALGVSGLPGYRAGAIGTTSNAPTDSTTYEAILAELGVSDEQQST